MSWWILFPLPCDTTRVTGRGDFHCVRCEARSRYERRVHQEKLDVLFFPVIPWGPKTVRVYCLRCGTGFDEGVLRSDQLVPWRAAALRHALRRVALQFMRAGGRERAEQRAFQAAYRDLTGEALADDAVEPEIARAASDPRSLAESLASAAPDLPERIKEELLKSALAFAVAGAPLSEDDRARLRDLGAALQMSSAHVHGVLATQAGTAD